MPDFWELSSESHRDSLVWLEAALDDLLHARGAHAMADVAKSVLGHEAYAVGFSYGLLFTAQSRASAEVGELVRTFVLAEAFDVLFGRRDPSAHLPFGLHVPLRDLGRVIGEDSMLHFRLETEQQHREALLRQLREVMRHSGELLKGLATSTRAEYEAEWKRIAELYRRGDVGERFEAGNRTGELFWKLLNLLAAMVAVGLLVRELAAVGPDLVRLARGLAARAEALPAEVLPPPLSVVPEPVKAPAVAEPLPVEPSAPTAPYEAPLLTATDGRGMFREALGNTKRAPAAQRAEVFDKYRANITEQTKGQWNAQRLDATNGTAFSGEGGETLAFDKAGNMYRGPANAETFPYTPGKGITINFGNLNPL